MVTHEMGFVGYIYFYTMVFGKVCLCHYYCVPGLMNHFVLGVFAVDFTEASFIT